jgi:hypothetical protein
MIRARDENQKIRATKRKWTYEEDQLLCQGYEIHGQEWENIAKYIGTRNGKQCRERYLSQFAPGLSNIPWSQSEDDILIEQQKIHGNKWKIISTFLHGRSFVEVKNRWCKFQRNLKKFSSNPREEIKETENDEDRWLEIRSIFDVKDMKSFYDIITNQSFMLGDDFKL